MGHPTDTVDLARLELSSGEARSLELEVAIDSLKLAGQSYEPTPTVTSAQLDIARTTAGYSLRLRFKTRLAGPCMRCLEDAGTQLAIDAREVDQPGGGEELNCPYLSEDSLDLRGWARDALALSLPDQIFCRAQCKGLCAVCGANLNTAGPDHRHESGRDERFAALDALKPFLR